MVRLQVMTKLEASEKSGDISSDGQNPVLTKLEASEKYEDISSDGQTPSDDQT